MDYGSSVKQRCRVLTFELNLKDTKEFRHEIREERLSRLGMIMQRRKKDDNLESIGALDSDPQLYFLTYAPLYSLLSSLNGFALFPSFLVLLFSSVIFMYCLTLFFLLLLFARYQDLISIALLFTMHITLSTQFL